LRAPAAASAMAAAGFAYIVRLTQITDFILLQAIFVRAGEHDLQKTKRTMLPLVLSVPAIRQAQGRLNGL
jgi:hypothetical protein